ncbi:MAG: hypothetical protein OFPII_29420 [Osedax symbiont Rs1]|nr:MAG: hypothetical protein OFPII_29420 [Osedax symbiont Rs1]
MIAAPNYTEISPSCEIAFVALNLAPKFAVHSAFHTVQHQLKHRLK